MLLIRVVETSRRIAATTKRLEKIDLLASLLKQLAPEEIEIVVAFLTGRTRQGRIGIGYASLEGAMGPAAEPPSLELTDLDRTFQSIAATEGPGSEGRRLRLLQDLFARATRSEQQFIQSLLMGELRQGAMAGLMLEAVARAAGVPAGRVRHAAMVAGDITAVARTLLEMGAAGLAQVRHETGRNWPKSCRISSGDRRVYTTFAIELEVAGEADAELLE